MAQLAPEEALLAQHPCGAAQPHTARRPAGACHSAVHASCQRLLHSRARALQVYAFALADPEPRDAHIYVNQTKHVVERAVRDFTAATAAAAAQDVPDLPEACQRLLNDSRQASGPGLAPVAGPGFAPGAHHNVSAIFMY